MDALEKQLREDSAGANIDIADTTGVIRDYFLHRNTELDSEDEDEEEVEKDAEGRGEEQQEEDGDEEEEDDDEDDEEPAVADGTDPETLAAVDAFKCGVCPGWQ
jgi:hypothetical protein